MHGVHLQRTRLSEYKRTLNISTQKIEIQDKDWQNDVDVSTQSPHAGRPQQLRTHARTMHARFLSLALCSL